MRHAWDTHRTGSELRTATEFFDRRDAETNTIDLFGDLHDMLNVRSTPSPAPQTDEPSSSDGKQESAKPKSTSPSFDPEDERFCSNVDEFCTEENVESPVFPGLQED